MEIDKEFIPHEEAMALKELGFDEPCLAMYRKNRLYHLNEPKRVNSEKESVISAPLWQQAFRWFREKNSDYDFKIKVVKDYEDGKIWNVSRIMLKYVYFINIGNTGMRKKHETREEAELACLQKLIELLKKKK